MSDAPTPRPASSCCGDHTTPSDAACCGGSAATPGSTTSCCGAPSAEDARPASAAARRLDVELLVIDLESCARCVPTGDQLRSAIRLLAPAAEALDIRLTYRETVAQTAEEARERALLSSPTIRVNGRDIDQDIHESVCESCGDLTDNEVSVDCREWHYRGRVYGAAPLPLLVEALMGAMLGLDEEPPVTPEPLAELPANLQRYFANKRPAGASGCCC